MAHYLVTAAPRDARLAELQNRLAAGEFVDLEPFGEELTECLRNARRDPTGRAVWEEEDYCSPPLDAERAAVLDDYFDDLRVRSVEEGAGWQAIETLPRLFPELAEAPGD